LAHIGLKKEGDETMQIHLMNVGKYFAILANVDDFGGAPFVASFVVRMKSHKDEVKEKDFKTFEESQDFIKSIGRRLIEGRIIKAL
jgi:Asp-tRNA(Asn)/Glu-tRNA(Gln) amidotransferase C subunit